MLFWGYGGALAAAVVLGGVVALVLAVSGNAPSTRTAVLGTVTAFGCLVGIAVIVFGIIFLGLLRQLQSAFALQAHYARHIWSSSTSN